jgi:hypothetical protein
MNTLKWGESVEQCPIAHAPILTLGHPLSVALIKTRMVTIWVEGCSLVLGLLSVSLATWMRKLSNVSAYCADLVIILSFCLHVCVEEQKELQAKDEG